MLSVSLEKAHVPATWIIAVLMVFGGWWVRANNAEIDNVKVAAGKRAEGIEALAAQNAKDIQTLTAQVQRLADREERLEADVMNAAKTANENKELLIRIAAKLEVADES